MSFIPNPVKFVARATNQDGYLIFENTMLPLIFFEERKPELRWKLDRVFRTVSGDNLRRRWWSMTELDACEKKRVRIAGLTFLGAKFSKSLRMIRGERCSEPLNGAEIADKCLYDAFVALERISFEIPFPTGHVASLVLELDYKIVENVVAQHPSDSAQAVEPAERGSQARPR